MVFLFLCRVREHVESRGREHRTMPLEGVWTAEHALCHSYPGTSVLCSAPRRSNEPQFVVLVASLLVILSQGDCLSPRPKLGSAFIVPSGWHLQSETLQSLSRALGFSFYPTAKSQPVSLWMLHWFISWSKLHVLACVLCRDDVISISEVLNYISGSSFGPCSRLLETAPVGSPAENLLGFRSQSRWVETSSTALCTGV